MEMTELKSLECTICRKTYRQLSVLNCKHQFCDICFESFISGSIIELKKFLRCCVCGLTTVLIKESKNEYPLISFGREGDNDNLFRPSSICNAVNSFCIIDQETNRVNVWKYNGDFKTSFPIIYQSRIHSAIAGNENLIVIAFQHQGFTILGFYSGLGYLENSYYMPTNMEITAISLLKNGDILIGESNGKLIIIDSISNLISYEWQLITGKTIGGICQLDNERIVISNTNENQIEFYNTKLQFQKSEGEFGKRPQQYDCPLGIACTINSSSIIIAVADVGNKRVQLLDKNGNFIKFIVRYFDTIDVFLKPVDVSFSKNKIAVLLKGENLTKAGEVRMYSI